MRNFLRTCAALLPALLTAACAVQQTSPSPAPALPAPSASAAAPAQGAPAGAAQAAALSPKAMQLRDWAAQQSRLNKVAGPLLLNGTPLCKQQARDLLGITARNKYSYSTDYVAEAASALGLGDSLQVVDVLPGSGAERAGIAPGDTLVAVESKPLAQGPDAERMAARAVSGAMRGHASVTLTVARDGRQRDVAVPLTRACAFGIELGDSEVVASYADGLRAMVTRGMLGYVRSDTELAFVLAKEFAHNMLTHGPRARMAELISGLSVPHVPGTAPAALAGIRAYAPVLDSTADKLSLYLLARSGYDIDEAIAFWKRLAEQQPEARDNNFTSLHPATPYRMSVMTQARLAIRSKQKNGQALLP